MWSKPGDVIVVDAGGDPNTSVCCGLMGGLGQNRGIRGMIADGADRDTDELEVINWPIWMRAITPRGAHTRFSGRKEETRKWVAQGKTIEDLLNEIGRI